MTDPRWAQTDEYLASHLVGRDEVLESAIKDSEAAGLPAIAVSPVQGKFLQVLAYLVGARRILEVGTLGGYSAICMARALPSGGSLVTLEVNPEHAHVAQANLERAGLGEVVQIVLGPAIDTLPRLVEEHGEASFDMAFIDADKPNNPGYWRWALKLVRPGGLVVVDNVVRDGKIADPSNTEEAVVGSRQVLEAMGAEAGAVASALQTVGAKTYDGFAIAVVGVPGRPRATGT